MYDPRISQKSNKNPNQFLVVKIFHKYAFIAGSEIDLRGSSSELQNLHWQRDESLETDRRTLRDRRAGRSWIWKALVREREEERERKWRFNYKIQKKEIKLLFKLFHESFFNTKNGFRWPVDLKGLKREFLQFSQSFIFVFVFFFYFNFFGLWFTLRSRVRTGLLEVRLLIYPSTAYFFVIYYGGQD